MIYKAALQIKLSNGKPALLPSQAFLMSILLADADGFNELDLDTQFFDDFLKMADPKVKAEHEEFVQECIKRVTVRLTLSDPSKKKLLFDEF